MKTCSVISMFRNSRNRGGKPRPDIDRYVEQLQNQADIHISQSFWEEGDSTDDTFDYLQDIALRVPWKTHILKYDTGRPFYGSIAHADRMAHLSDCAERLRLFSLQQGTPTDYVLWVESDLILGNPHLVSKLAEHDVDMVAPIVWLGKQFYDTWGFIGIKGEAWWNGPCYTDMFALYQDRLLPMSSVGSCVLMKWDVWKNSNWGNDAFRAFCSSARGNGYKIFVDRELSIRHPE